MLLTDISKDSRITLHAILDNDSVVECEASIIARKEDYIVIKVLDSQVPSKILVTRPLHIYAVHRNTCYHYDELKVAIVYRENDDLPYIKIFNKFGYVFERRKFIRYTYNRKCTLTSKLTSISSPAKILDISEEGIGLECDVEYDVGTSLFINFEEPSLGSFKLDVAVDIVRNDGKIKGCMLKQKNKQFSELVENIRNKRNMELLQDARFL